MREPRPRDEAGPRPPLQLAAALTGEGAGAREGVEADGGDGLGGVGARGPPAGRQMFVSLECARIERPALGILPERRDDRHVSSTSACRTATSGDRKSTRL